MRLKEFIPAAEDASGLAAIAICPDCGEESVLTGIPEPKMQRLDYAEQADCEYCHGQPPTPVEPADTVEQEPPPELVEPFADNEDLTPVEDNHSLPEGTNEPTDIWDVEESSGDGLPDGQQEGVEPQTAPTAEIPPTN